MSINVPYEQPPSASKRSSSGEVRPFCESSLVVASDHDSSRDRQAGLISTGPRIAVQDRSFRASPSSPVRAAFSGRMTCALLRPALALVVSLIAAPLATAAESCRLTYGVKFSMFAKTTVGGEHVNALYAQLAKVTGTEAQWNFHKYLI